LCAGDALEQAFAGDDKDLSTVKALSIVDMNKQRIRMKPIKALSKKLTDFQRIAGGDGSLIFDTEFNEN